MNTKPTKLPDTIAIILILILTLPVLYFSLFVPFETDCGDSIVHYSFARYAMQHPILFLDHWAKPFFTLLASPFAQFGFAGIKLFNGLAGLFSAWFAYGIARKLELRFPWLAMILVMFAPAYFVKLFSGYTEPLFGLVLIASIYLILIERPYFAALLISFLPFVRSEGLILIMVFALYFLMLKNYKAIILLTTGHIIYSLVGFLAGKSLFWIFTEIPYSVVSTYGRGNFAHYPTQLLLTLGVPFFLLACSGILILLLDITPLKIRISTNYKSETRLLLLGSFVAYFLFHTISWRFGLFGSMGMSRVLIAMVPILAVIALFGLNFMVNWKFDNKFPFDALIYIPLIAYILIFPFLHNPASIDWNKDLRRTPEMKLVQTISADIEKQYAGKFLYYSNPYFSYILDINPFDKSKHFCFTDWQFERRLHPNSLVIWDNWFSVVEERTDSLSLYQNPELRLIRRYETDASGSKNIFLVFGN